MEEIHILTAFMEIIAQGEECTIFFPIPKATKTEVHRAHETLMSTRN